MNFKRNYSTLVPGLFGLALILVLTYAANSQGRFANVYSRTQVSSIISQLEQSSDTFRRNFDRAMDNSSINGTSTERRYNEYVSNYESSLDRLRREYDRFDTWWENRANVEIVLRDARPVNDMMNTISFRRNLERQWMNMRNDINKLADTFDLPGLEGGGWAGGGGGGWTGGGPQGNVPAWAQGTFYARNPQTGGTIQMTVVRNGNVTLIFDGGAPVYASMNRTILTNGPYRSRVTRLDNGIRTTDVTNGSYIDYFRTPIGGGGMGQQGLVPNWAQGTFYARNPQTGGTIQMTVDRSGQVALVYDGGAPTYASMYRTTLTNGPYVSRVSRLNNGIRTTDVSNGSYIDYYRNPIAGGGGQQGDVPNWATGTFYARNPQTGGTIEMTVLRNGNVTISFDGAAPVYASMNGTTLTNGPYVSRVSRLNNGIRTTDVTNGSYIDYFRR